MTGDTLLEGGTTLGRNSFEGLWCSKDAKKELQENLKEQRTSEKSGKKQMWRE